LGILFVLGVAADLLGRRAPLPRVTTGLVYGILAWPSGFDLLAESIIQALDKLSNVTLLLVSFL
jgi:Kef-type K+ transport system membrane component KefB